MEETQSCTIIPKDLQAILNDPNLLDESFKKLILQCITAREKINRSVETFLNLEYISFDVNHIDSLLYGSTDESLCSINTLSTHRDVNKMTGAPDADPFTSTAKSPVDFDDFGRIFQESTSLIYSLVTKEDTSPMDSFGVDHGSFAAASPFDSDCESVDGSFQGSTSPTSSVITDVDAVEEESSYSEGESHSSIDEAEERRQNVCLRNLEFLERGLSELCEEFTQIPLEDPDDIDYDNLEYDPAWDEIDDGDFERWGLLDHQLEARMRGEFELTEEMQEYEQEYNYLVNTDINPYNMMLTTKGPDCLLYSYRNQWMPFLEWHSAVSEEASGTSDDFDVLHPAFRSSPSPSPEPFYEDDY